MLRYIAASTRGYIRWAGVAFDRSVSYLMPSGGRGSCLGLRTGVSPHFSTNSKREMLADHERGAASPPSSPMPDFRGCTLTRPRSHTDCARSTSKSASAATPRFTSTSHCYQLQFLTVTPLLHVARRWLISPSFTLKSYNTLSTIARFITKIYYMNFCLCDINYCNLYCTSKFLVWEMVKPCYTLTFNSLCFPYMSCI